MFSPGYSFTGFLAFLSSDIEAPSGGDPIPFDTAVYDYGNNYDPSTGIYTVPYNGLYLIQSHINGLDHSATHYIKVDGEFTTYSRGYDGDYIFEEASTTIVLHLQSGQEVGVDPGFSGRVDGYGPVAIRTYFGATLLYPD